MKPLQSTTAFVKIAIGIMLILGIRCSNKPTKGSEKKEAPLSENKTELISENKTEVKGKSHATVHQLSYVKGYQTKYKMDSLPEFVYMDIEMFNDVGIDLDDLEATLTAKDGSQYKSSVFESFFLDKEGKRAKESPENNKKGYCHVGLIFPVKPASQKIQLQYWGGPLYGTVWDIQPGAVALP